MSCEYPEKRTPNSHQEQDRNNTDEDSSDDEFEGEVYYRVIFHIQTWDGKTTIHEADVSANVLIRDLKEELKDELGDPNLTDWILAKNEMRMADDQVIYKNYPVDHNDQINVFVRKLVPGQKE